MEPELDSSPGGRRVPCYRIAVRGQLSQSFVEPLAHVRIEPSGEDSVIICEVDDQARLQGILTWLYSRQVEIVSVTPEV